MELGSTNKQISQMSKDVRLLLESVYYKAWDGGVGESRLEVRTNPVNGAQEKHSKLYFLYRPGTSITWNGHALTVDGIDKLTEQLLHIKTKHTIRALDVQPIIDENHALALVTGSCRYNDETVRSFSQTLIIWKEKVPGESRAKYWIIHENYRWIKPDE
eukprot:TRINITY_DN19495_c0_g1_i1.p1 TRINITY_DN19495_c0_g1~~TRINITY_DN19495_c0_g1_i1.p1  ORF type:complete len:179 (+),score=23.01 TRINITY_DN19495_c0_g1_i1:63-539(+)